MSRGSLIAVLSLIGCTSASAQIELPRTISDIVALLERPGPESEEIIRARAILARPPGASPADRIQAYEERARAAARVGQIPQLIAAREQLVALHEGDRNQPKHLIDLAINQMTSGDWAQAEKNARRAANAPTAWWGQDLVTLAVLARMQSWLGDVRSARTSTSRAEELFARARRYPQAQPFLDFVPAMIAWAQADAALADGKALDGERALRFAYERALEDTRIAEQRMRSVEQAPASDVTWQLLDLIEAQLARLHIQQGRIAESEAVARRMLTRAIDRYGPRSPSTGVALAALGEVLVAQARWREALAIGDLAARTLRDAGVSPNSGYAFYAERARVDARIGRSEWTEAVQLIDQMRGGARADPVMLRATERVAAWALALVRAGRATEAETWLARLVEEHERFLGANRYETAESRGLHGVALAALGLHDRAQAVFAAALPALLARRREADTDGLDAMRQLKRRAILEGYVGLLYERHGSRGATAIAEAFRIGDALQAGSVQKALAASAARAMAGTPHLGTLIRKEQDLKRELTALKDRLLVVAVSPDSKERDQALADLRRRVAALDDERGTTFRQIESQFPDYANLVSPAPATLDDARRALAPGEVLIAIVPGETRTYVWAVLPSGKAVFYAAEVGERQLGLQVTALRRALDPDTLRTFDLAAAHRMYHQLLAPSQNLWNEAQVLVAVTGGVLGQLPLSLLPITPDRPEPSAIPFAEMRQVPWLVRRLAITHAPSVNSFVRLRAIPQSTAQRSAFIGFGDPSFAKAPGPKAPPAGSRGLGIARITESTDVTREAVAYTEYRNLAPLPDTREEILAIARALGANADQDVFLGARASKTVVKSLDLARRKIVMFATHGLLAGDIPGLTQPALALAALEDPNDSPLLTLEDVLSLKLDADWVVLSACNTAAGDGRGTETLSGLGRGFFYAGSRSLLATHWPVETVSARLLTTSLFERYAHDPDLTRAQALRQATLALMDSPGPVDRTGNTAYSYAHPFFWAPYALYGDGSR